ncbi:hypothetical protein JKG68_07430 [Microvirga aerilata]|uniref:DUF2393 domain-containing protein n=1 Tax=Microvirga aerilata TaxID=670292 RepID=A0A936ZDK9_9HYPH|nr:hypothetical protein [Microvirga aerilata]MBL0403790.1 hypothetical protein [Microvirga aerilata]
MAESDGILIAVGLLMTVVAVLVYGVGWLIVATPFMRWCLISVVGIPALRVLLLPFDILTIWWTGEYPEVVFADELKARTHVTLSTQISTTRRSGKFTLLAQGSLTNNSDREIESISVWCRVPKLGFGDSEAVVRRIAVTVAPRETKSFSGEIASDLTGIAKTSHVALQVPDQHFCRLDRVYTST